MVDPNPARGMPLQLQKYWLTGKGAAQIRWNTPGDFLRCVSRIRKYFPKEPEGLCNILHQKATGGAPGHGSNEHSLLVPEGYEEATALLAASSVLSQDLWAGPLAPIDVETDEPGGTRLFEQGSLFHRTLPLPLRFRRQDGPGHTGAVTVGRIMGVTQGPDEYGNDFLWGWGDWLDASIVPEVTEARYLVDQGVAGSSVDPGGRVTGVVNPETGGRRIQEYVMGGATLVSIPAFSQTRLYNLVEGEWPDSDTDMADSAALMESATGEKEVGCGCDDFTVDQFTVNASGWKGLPLAARESTFDNDDAVKRITAWAAGGQDTAKMRQAFLWFNSAGNPADPTSYRLPLGDIVNGRLTLVFHAIYAAAALLSGAHGGLPDIPDADKAQIRGVISAIYPEMAKAFDDSSIMAPWDRPAAVQAKADAEASVSAETLELAAGKEPYGDVKYADPGYQEDGTKRYPLDTEEHVRAAWSYINVTSNAGRYSPEDLERVRNRIRQAARRMGVSISAGDPDDEEYSVASVYPLEPPKVWFEDPGLTGPTHLTVTAEGRVFGHLAQWDTCHRDVQQRSCVLAPRSRKDYAPFHLGSVLTSEGEEIMVGKIVMDTRHAGIRLSYAAAAIHYDHTGDEVAVVRAGEDSYGVWVAGSLVPEATPAKAAKLRRSPLSGDWRGVDGNLELTAALAVNVPAFPVFSTEGDTGLALVAAGQVLPVQDTEADAEEQDERAWQLRALMEEDWLFEQWKRAQELAAIMEADGDRAPVVPDADPVYGTAAVLARQMDAQFLVTEEEADDDSDSKDVPAPV